jgi:triosephosphate isomerase
VPYGEAIFRKKIMRRPIIIGNWKMYTNLADAMILTEAVKHGVEHLEGVDIVLCPPFPWLYAVRQELAGGGPTHLSLGAQNVFTEEEGPYTGEVSVRMLKGLVRFILIGHSERRYKIAAGEDDATVNKKVKLALSFGFQPILCVGERAKQEKRGRGRPRLEHGIDIVEQIKRSLAGIPAGAVSRIVVAYEPVWAIGTGTPASGEYAESQIVRLRTALKDWYGAEVAELTRIVYGGSTDSQNASEFLRQKNIDGLLPGGSSLKATEFIFMCKIAAGVKKAVA